MFRSPQTWKLVDTNDYLFSFETKDLLKKLQQHIFMTRTYLNISYLHIKVMHFKDLFWLDCVFLVLKFTVELICFKYSA